MAAGGTKKKAASVTPKDAGIGFRAEILAIALLALAVLLTLSIVSYSPQDNTLLSGNPENVVTRNYIGPFGANIAIFLIQFFGYAAGLLPLSLFVIGGCLILRVPVSAGPTKSIGIAGLLISAAVLLSFFVPDLVVAGIAHSFPGGGIVGQFFLGILRSVFGDIGVLIIAGAVLGISALLAVHFSFAAFFAGLWNWYKSRRQAKRDARTAERAARGIKPDPGPKVVVRLALGRKSAAAEPMTPAAMASAPEQSPAAELSRAELESLLPKKKGGKKAADSEDEFRPQVAPPKRRSIASPDQLIGMQAPVDLLNEAPSRTTPLNLKMLAEQARLIIARYREFGVDGEIIQTNPGPVVNTFEFKPAPGIKYSKVVGLADELCLALKAVSIRINRLAGKSTIGIEVPAAERETIFLREIVESPEYQNSRSPLTLAMGKSIDGDPYVARLDDMPHLLIAGATGTGKSVALNTMICSILFKSPPETTRFILVDPKQVELSIYAGIPHLLTPVVSHPKKAASALRWACEEMEVRYRRLAVLGVRNIAQYNELVREADGKPPQEGMDPLDPMSYIVVIIDELADLMMVSSHEVEESICRLAQKARAVGIHLIIATQRPSVDVLTGVIKANFQCRVSFRVATKVDSRTVLDCNGAEDLLGNGDMLYLPPRTSRLIRLHGPWVTEKEIHRLVDHLRRRYDQPQFDDSILSMSEGEEDDGGGFDDSLAPERDPLFDEAVNLVLATGVASISNLQRKMRLGYARAARIIDMMEQDGIIGPADGAKPREILAGRDR